LARRTLFWFKNNVYGQYNGTIRIVKKNIISIDNGDIEMPNRIDGIFIGNKKNLFDFILRKSSVRYVVFKTFLSAIEEIKNDISPVNEKEKDTFFIDLNEENHDIINILFKIEHFDYAFFFDKNNKCLFYANDDLEDVTIII
jgi:hypothetical protein